MNGEILVENLNGCFPGGLRRETLFCYTLQLVSAEHIVKSPKIITRGEDILSNYSNSNLVKNELPDMG